MQIILIGLTKSGKSLLAEGLVKRGWNIHEAGAWVREAFKKEHGDREELSRDFKNELTEMALRKLRDDPWFSAKIIEDFGRSAGEKKVIAGIRNLDDLISALKMDERNLVVTLGGGWKPDGTLGGFDRGVKVIDDYLSWKDELGLEPKTMRLKEDQEFNEELLDEIERNL